jgi:hypothetical protein
MRAGWVLVLAWLLFSGCANEGGKVKEQTDSLGREIDSAFNKVSDSTKKTLKNLKRRIEEKLEKDSLK